MKVGQNQLRGIILALVAMFILSVMDLLAKYLSQSVPVPQIVWARYFFQFVIMAAIFWPRRRWNLVRTKKPGLQIVRSILLVACTYIFFVAIQYMPLAEAVAISFVSPLMVTALSVPLLSEKVGMRRWTAVAIGFVGAMVIVRPGFGVVHWAAWMLLVLALFYALYQILTRMLSDSDDPMTTLFISAVVGAVLASLVVPFFWQAGVSVELWSLLAALGVLGGLGHYTLIKSFEYAPVAVLAPLSYTALLWNTIFGYWFFGDLPDRWTLIGAAILIATGIYIIYREGVHKEDEAAPNL